MNKKKCPVCRCSGDKVLYAGIPLRLCVNEKCNNIWGLWSFLMLVVPFNGYFLVYEGNYFIALWDWLTEPTKIKRGKWEKED